MIKNKSLSMMDPNQKRLAVSRHHEVIDRLIKSGITDSADLLRMTLSQLGSKRNSAKIKKDIHNTLVKKGLLDNRNKLARILK